MIAEKYLPLATVESAAFREMVRALNTRAKIPSRTGIKRIMENMRVALNEELHLLIHGQFVCVTSDSWTSAAGHTYLGITYHWIDADWNLNSMTVDCELLQGSTVGEELAEKVPKAWRKRDVAGVVVHVTDCEPAMVKMGRIVKEKLELPWQGCTDHRLEKTAEQFYKHEGVLDCCERAKKVVTCIHTSSQVEMPCCLVCSYACVARVSGLFCWCIFLGFVILPGCDLYFPRQFQQKLRLSCQLYGVDYVDPPNDVKTRWWSTYLMFEALLQLRKPLSKMDLPTACPRLSELDWWVLQVGEEVLRPLMLAMVELEGQKYVTGSLVIPMVEAIRKGLNEANERLKELSESIGEQVLENGKDFNMESILAAMIEDFENRWGDGFNINKYSCRLGTNRGQPCGYTKEQILCFTLDPRMVQLPHVQEHQEEAVWLVLEDRCQELIVEDHTELASSAFVAPRVQTSTAPTKQLLGCTKLAKMMAPSGSVTHKVAVDATRLAEQVSPGKMSK